MGGTSDPVNYGRVRLATAELARSPGSRATIRIALERSGATHEVEREGVGEEIMILRLAAQATLDALDRAIGRERHFQLVGVKRLQAFDTLVVLACVRPADEPTLRLVGCVPAPDDLVRGAATAVLHATNRLVERLPPPEGGAGQAADEGRSEAS